MKEIWKYTLGLNHGNGINMPKGSKILHVDEQYGNICLWVEVDARKDCPKEERYFEIFGTGHVIYEDVGFERKYLGTVKLESSTLIFHIYERIKHA